MKLKREDIVVGLNVRAYDEEEMIWYKAEVVKIREEVVVFQDIDPGSSYQGMKWDTPWDEIGDTDQYRKLK